MRFTERSDRRLALAVSFPVLHAISAIAVGPTPAGSLASNALQLAAAITAAVLCWSASRRSFGFARRFWTLVSTAFWIWSAAQASYLHLENWLGTGVEQPSWTHLLFRLYGGPLLMALLITHDDEDRPSPDWLLILDFAQVGILFLFFYFDMYFAPGTDWRGLTGLNLWGFIDLSDLENWLLFAAFATRARWARHPEERALVGRLAAYLFCYAMSSSFYNYAYSFWEPRTGEWHDLVFTFSLTLASLTAATWRSEGEETQTAAHPDLFINWTPAFLPLITLGLALPMARHEPDLAFVAVLGSVACFGARLLATLYRSQILLEALRSSEARYASLLRLAPDAIFVHEGGKITFANPATARVFGVGSFQELVGRNVLDFVPPERRSELLVEWDHVTAEPAVKRMLALRTDGTRLPLDAVAMSFESDSGSSLKGARLVIARDITDRDRAEAEREALIQALEAKNSELERFTYTVSHDLRSPLITVTAFLSHIEAAAARGDMAAMHGDIQRVRRAARKMDLLLHDLLELSRVGHVLGPLEPVAFEPLVREAIDLVAGRLKEISVTVVVEPDLPTVRGDRVRLLEVMQNLLDNAAKFMGDQNAPQVVVGCRLEAGETVLFVRDNGIGIEPRFQDRVFGLFDKLDPSGPGTGVGLALVKRIIELHGGRIWVESRGAGEGSTFCFTLPEPDGGTL